MPLTGMYNASSVKPFAGYIACCSVPGARTEMTMTQPLGPAMPGSHLFLVPLEQRADVLVAWLLQQSALQVHLDEQLKAPSNVCNVEGHDKDSRRLWHGVSLRK